MLIIGIKVIRRPRRGCVFERNHHASAMILTSMEALEQLRCRIGWSKNTKVISGIMEPPQWDAKWFELDIRVAFLYYGGSDLLGPATY